MDIVQAVILGIVQGLTEFLPISSTAHLRIVPALFGWDDPGAAFTAVIQFGTLAAVLIYFYKDIVKITGSVIKGIAHRTLLHDQDAVMGWMIAAGTVPIGIAQAVALIPGSSRSGTTITGGLFLGLNRETAARFSFLLSLPSIFAAGMLELVKERELLFSSDIGAVNLITATVVSGIVGYASIAFLLNYLKSHSTYLFIIYRIVVGISLFYLLWAGILPPQ